MTMTSTTTPAKADLPGYMKGMVTESGGNRVLYNPRYELVPSGPA